MMMTRWPLAMALLLLLLLEAEAEAATKAGDAAVLRALREGIDNAEQILGWKAADEDPCSWRHIQCQDGAVTGIFLQSLGLRGSLPGSLNGLQSLTNLALQGNALSGALPSLSGLPKLQLAFLNDNAFRTIPHDFFRQLPALRGMYLSNNPLNGWRLPPDLRASSQLANLSLDNTTLVGSLPDFLGQFSNLQMLSVAYNRLSGPLPASLNGTALQVLRANSQNLGGGLDVLASLPSLTSAWLHLNNFSGTIPAALPDGLQELLVSENHLVGAIPPNLARMRSLRNLSVQNNLLDGPLPAFPATVSFSFEHNYFCGNGSGCAPEVNALLALLAGVGYPPDVVKSWAGNDPCTGPWTGVSCGSDGKVSVVNLAKRGLAGTIDAAVGNLSSLTVLKLNDNHLSGNIPESLVLLKSLKQVDVSNNNLSGLVPGFPSGVSVNTVGNPLIGKVLPPQASPPGGGSESNAAHRKHKGSAAFVGIVAGCVVSAAIVVLLVIFFLKRRRKIRAELPEKPLRVPEASSSAAAAAEGIVGSQGYTVYPLWVLHKATENFSAARLLGKGGFGSVYEGVLQDGTKVAVKRMDPALLSSKGLQEFQAELNMLGKVRHRNLVAVLGYCTDNNERLLVYEYMSQGTLSQHLFAWHDKGLQPLDWNARLLIALDVAHGMQYLHNLAYRIIIHRDLKPSNILLDESLRAKVSDFGLAKLAAEDKVSVETRLAGTFGYLAPEYAATGRVNTKSDVYSFGVVLMELITGQRALDEKRPEDRVHLVPWFRHICRDHDELVKIIDPAVQVTEEAMMKSITAVAELAWHCTHSEASARPDMGYAVAVLVPLVRQWKPCAVHAEGDDSHQGMTADQVFKQWKIFDDSSFSIPDAAGSSQQQQTWIAPPASVSAR